MQATVTWKQDMRFDCATDTGYQTEMDGTGGAMSPMENVLLSVGACSSIDVVEILKKSRLDIRDCRCELQAERAENPPRVFTKIHAQYIVSGPDLKEKQVARAVELSVEKYCSVMLMINKSVEITTSYKIEN